MAENQTNDVRIEKDSMGDVHVPAWAYWGAQTQRAKDNFPVSGYKIPQPMLRGLAMVKRYAAEVNAEMGLVDKALADKIIEAAEEAMEGKLTKHFPLDVFQTGSGTSSNMNMNEVLSNRANELLGHPLGGRHPVHPNDHVNRGQSSNDVIPTSIHIGIRTQLSTELLPALEGLHNSLRNKQQEFKDVVKIGRTHLMDAVPLTLGQEFGGYATQIQKGIQRIRNTFPHMEELALGGTAVGTGLNSHQSFAPNVIAKIAQRTGIPFRQADDLFEALAARDALVEVSGALNTLAVSLMKIANDLRLLNSGPRTAIAEIQLPELQPGSSIMPGKVNPVIGEMMIQVAAWAMGQHSAISVAGQSGLLDLHVMKPMMANTLLETIRVLSNACSVLDEKAIQGTKANVEQCNELVEWSMAIVTPLALNVGYDKASDLAKQAFKERKKVRQVVVEEGILSQEDADRIMDPKTMLGPKKG